jgi:hypothetical protein
MGWEIGYEPERDRDVGYGVPAECDHPDCHERIDRGLYYVCGGQPYGEPHGCGLFFCDEHMSYEDRTEPRCADQESETIIVQLCERCAAGSDQPFDPKPDIEEWVQHKETDPSWAQWRAERDAKAAAPHGREG